MKLTIVLDSNIWLCEQMLRHSTGSAVRFFMRKHGARIAVPEVVRLEVERHLERQLTELSSQLRDGHTRLLRIVGELKELILPSDDELRDVAKNSFTNAGIDIVDFPFSIESARSSLEKCIRSEPPSGPKNQQFKDGVIWADCLGLADKSPVHFVTQDKAFYEGKDYKKGLAANLLAEARSVPHKITIAHEVRSIFDFIGEPIQIDKNQLHEQYYPQIREGTERLVGSEGFILGDLLNGQHAVFATENPDVAHVEFSLRYCCNHPSKQSGILLAKGECVFRPSTGKLDDFRNRSEEFQFQDDEGEQQKRNRLWVSGNAVSGHRTVKHAIRASLDQHWDAEPSDEPKSR